MEKSILTPNPTCASITPIHSSKLRDVVLCILVVYSFKEQPGYPLFRDRASNLCIHVLALKVGQTHAGIRSSGRSSSSTGVEVHLHKLPGHMALRRANLGRFSALAREAIGPFSDRFLYGFIHGCGILKIKEEQVLETICPLTRASHFGPVF